jgi:FlaA1/EpsC-like NDP-sugar epimerase
MYNPFEAIQTNVLVAAKNVIDAAMRRGACARESRISTR